METNRSIFESRGIYIKSVAEILEIQISNSGDRARYRSVVRYSSRGTEVIHGRWQEIRYTKRKSRPYITMFGKKLYLDKPFNYDKNRSY